jgi:hypothetical protein
MGQGKISPAADDSRREHKQVLERAAGAVAELQWPKDTAVA